MQAGQGQGQDQDMQDQDQDRDVQDQDQDWKSSNTRKILTGRLLNPKYLGLGF